MTMKMEADVALRSLQRPFRKLQIVEDWKQQYRVHSGRYKFLVLTGPSCMGKTQFALSLSPIGASLHLNMAVAPEPDLREFKYLHHDLILFDEAGPEQVVRQRLVFQAGNSWVQLGCSPTNQASYKVWMYVLLHRFCSPVSGPFLGPISGPGFTDISEWVQMRAQQFLAGFPPGCRAALAASGPSLPLQTLMPPVLHR